MMFPVVLSALLASITVADAPISPAIGVTSISMNLSIDTGASSTVDVDLGRFALRHSWLFADGSCGPGRVIAAFPGGMIGDLVPAGLYRRMSARLPASLFEHRWGTTPLVASDGVDRGDGVDLVVTTPEGLSRLGAFNDAEGSGVRGAYLALRPVEAISLEMVATCSGIDDSSSSTGWTVARPPIFDARLSHLAASLAAEGKNATFAAELFLGGGKRITPGIAFAIGLDVAPVVEAALDFGAAVEFAGRSPAYIGPGGSVPLREAVYRAEASLGTGFFSCAVSHRIDVELRDPVPGIFRPTTERIDISGTVGGKLVAASSTIALARTIGSSHAGAVEALLSPELRFGTGMFSVTARWDIGLAPTGIKLDTGSASASLRFPGRHRRTSVDVDFRYRYQEGFDLTVAAGIAVGRSSVSVRGRLGMSERGVSIESFSATIRGKSESRGYTVAETR